MRDRAADSELFPPAPPRLSIPKHRPHTLKPTARATFSFLIFEKALSKHARHAERAKRQSNQAQFTVDLARARRDRSSTSPLPTPREAPANPLLRQNEFSHGLSSSKQSLRLRRALSRFIPSSSLPSSKSQRQRTGKIKLHYPSHVNVRILGRFTRFEEAARAHESNIMGCERDFCMSLNVYNACLGV